MLEKDCLRKSLEEKMKMLNKSINLSTPSYKGRKTFSSSLERKAYLFGYYYYKGGSHDRC